MSGCHLHLFTVRLQQDLADWTTTLGDEEIVLYFCDLPGTPPQFNSFPDIFPPGPSKQLQAGK
jgi:hypothetical protein